MTGAGGGEKQGGIGPQENFPDPFQFPESKPSQTGRQLMALQDLQRPPGQRLSRQNLPEPPGPRVPGFETDSLRRRTILRADEIRQADIEVLLEIQGEGQTLAQIPGGFNFPDRPVSGEYPFDPIPGQVKGYGRDDPIFGCQMILMLPEEILSLIQHPDSRKFSTPGQTFRDRIHNPDPGFGPALIDFRQGQLAEFSETDDKNLAQKEPPRGKIPMTEGNLAVPSGKKRSEASGVPSRPVCL